MLTQSLECSPMAEDENFEQATTTTTTTTKQSKPKLSRSKSIVLFDKDTFRFPIHESSELKDFWNEFYNKNNKNQSSSSEILFLDGKMQQQQRLENSKSNCILMVQIELSLEFDM